MNLKHYKIVCTKCKGESQVDIQNNQQVFWTDVDKVISARHRLDNEWGFQCLCGNNDLMSKQESNYISDPVQPSTKDIEGLMKIIKVEKPRFKMVAV